MRLGQLARHLDINTNQIVDFLAEKNIEIKNHPNVKVADEDEQMVILHFGGELLESHEPEPVETGEVKEEIVEEITKPEIEEVIQESIAEDNVEVDDNQEELIAEAEEVDEIIENVEETIDQPIAASEEASPLSTEENVEVVFAEGDFEEDHPIHRLKDGVIKAPKVELPGLKVLGKIELQKPKVVEESEAPDEAELTTEISESSENSIAAPVPEPKIRYDRHHKRNSRPKLTDEQKEERRLRNKRAKERRVQEQAERQKRKEEAEKKAKKEEYYKEKLTKKPVGTKTKKKKVKAKQEQQPAGPAPKTVLGKFWKWLNT